jgi:hypothetical protein
LPSFQAFFNINWNERVQPSEELTEDEADYIRNQIAYDYVCHVLGDLTVAEESTVNGRLAQGDRPKAIAYQILAGRDVA